MKRVLFVIGQLRVGGVSKALVNLLNSLSDEYDVSLLCFDCEGSFFKEIPCNVHVLPTTGWLMLTENSASRMKREGFRFYIGRIVLSAVTKIFGKRLSSKLLKLFVRRIPGEYDVAISYTHPMPERMFCNLGGEIVLDCVTAKKKCVFIHCDFASYGGNCEYNRQLIRRFDVVAAVSNSVGRVLADSIPGLGDRLCVVRNCHSFDDIKLKADICPVTYKHKLNFVTVARLSEEKGLLRCFDAFVSLHQEGYDVAWHIVGGGPLKNELLSKIMETGAEDYIILEGEQVNSYRYLKNADCLLVTSYHEAAPMVFDEAAVLGVPVISTRTLSAQELVADRGIGWVCDNTDDALQQEIRRFVVSAANGTRTGCAVLSNEDALKEFSRLCED